MVFYLLANLFGKFTKNFLKKEVFNCCIITEFELNSDLPIATFVWPDMEDLYNFYPTFFVSTLLFVILAEICVIFWVLCDSLECG